MTLEKRTLVYHLTHFCRDFGLPNRQGYRCATRVVHVSIKDGDIRLLVEVFNDWYHLVHMVKSGCSFRLQTGQIASTGLVSLSYVQKVSEKVSLATDFMYNHMSKDVTASSRLRGKVDTNGTISALLEERINQHATLVLSAEVDHRKKDNKFGIDINVGE
ncbi:hypothetical protein ZWY2020_057107 [Hordeum vulgare]|nr:hypothetical protein ZWY2020_057107 [Hordeum vulgare]